MDKDVIKDEKSDATRTQKVLKFKFLLSVMLIPRELCAKAAFASSRQAKVGKQRGCVKIGRILFFIVKPRLSQARALLCPSFFVPLDKVF